MITLNRRKHGLPFRVVWFSPEPRFQLWPPTVYRQSPGVGPQFGLVRQPFHTFVTGLDGDSDSWLALMSSTTRNEIKQAAKAGVEGFLVAQDTFLEFFNAFAAEKGIEGTTREKLTSYGPSLWLTGARLADRTLAMHAVMVDQALGRGRLLLSASARFLDSADRTQVGKANRWLHWWEMGVLAKEGLVAYDWGGYAKDTIDPSKQGINRFKEAFGGVPVEESHYFPFYLAGFQD